MQSFGSGREAKEYLIDGIVAAADRVGTPLSDVERKMMYFSESAWTLPEIGEVNEAFERDYDQAAYEGKIGTLAQEAKRLAKANHELRAWNDAVRALKREDHYLLVLLETQPQTSDSFLVDRLKLVGTALLICALMGAGMIIFASLK